MSRGVEPDVDFELDGLNGTLLEVLVDGEAADAVDFACVSTVVLDEKGRGGCTFSELAYVDVTDESEFAERI